MAQPLHKVFTFDGYKVRLFSRRFLAGHVDRKSNTVAIWQVRKLVPPPIISMNEKSSWYTANEVEIYVRAVSLNDPRPGADLEGSPFSQMITGEVKSLHKKIRENGFQWIKPAIDLEVFIRELKLLRETCNWRPVSQREMVRQRKRERKRRK